MKNALRASLLPLLFCALLLGAGCPRQMPPVDLPAEREEQTEEQAMEDAGIPDDGLDAALKELDIVDEESPSRGGY